MFLFCSLSWCVMPPSLQQQRLAALRHVIADIERKPALSDPAKRLDSASTQGFPVLPAGLVQEVFCDAQRDTGASLGFALAQAKALMSAKRPAVFYLQLEKDSQSLGLPYGPGLSSFGIDPRHLVIVRTADMAEFLWAAEEIVSCRAVAAIVADVRGEPKLLNFTASRRLTMRASSNKVSLFMLRYGDRRESSASALRWRLTPYRSGKNPYDDRGIGAARWRLQLEKGRIAGNQVEWLVEWTKNGIAVVAQPANTNPWRFPTPVPGAQPAILADRLSQAG
ncbi:ImuA family protein [Devosia rhizoryzae]|uniref:Protein ImuA n=1 Tax=Devosia rhizoryzae TaxID=2774137 RepID=A0ABX7C8X6_9HYPH|nr:hypothetical protein [Devosia rhizoryzae]QQR39162.1 hypothetical protein JI748_15755 [Devosia rhizoryzae]